jgi:hypothetical protein
LLNKTSTFIVESQLTERENMNKAPTQLQKSIKNYYKDLNEFIKQQQIKEGLEKLRSLSNKANNK